MQDKSDPETPWPSDSAIKALKDEMYRQPVIRKWYREDIDAYQAVRQLFNMGYRGKDLDLLRAR
jgi:hypothetical protein